MKQREITEYFHPRPFVGNNIQYRIASSASLARFKESQTYLLNQLAFNPFHKFSYSAKEILLLKYDICFDLLCEIEQYILVKQNKIEVSELRGFVTKRTRYFIDLIDGQENIDPLFFETWKEIHSSVFKYFLKNIYEILNTKMELSSKFGSIVDLSINIMNHTLYELQEIDLILYTKKTPAFNLDMLSCDSSRFGENCRISNRISILRKIRDFDHIIIKNYLSESLPFETTPFYKYLKKNNIKYNLV